MTTADIVLSIILTALLSIFFLLWIVVTVLIIKLLNSVRHVVAKAEEVVDSVETATEVLKDAQGKFALFKLIRGLYKLVQKKGRA